MKVLLATVAVLTTMSLTAFGAIIVQETFTDNRIDDFTQGGDSYGSPSHASSTLQIDANADTFPNVDTFLAGDASGSGGQNFIGDGQGDYATGADMGGLPVLGVSFDFYVDAGNDASAPSELNVYFTASSGNAWRWRILDVSSVGYGTTPVGANFGDSYTSSWGSWELDGGTATEGAWDTDIASVTSIGFEIGYLVNAPGAEMYQIDNFALLSNEFLVPEPETYLVLGMALLSIVIVFRKRITDSLAEARAIMHS